MSEYQFWYYCVYSWCLKAWGPSDQPQWNAILGLSLAGAVNLGSLAVIAREVGFGNLQIPGAILPTAYVLILGVHYWLFIRNGRFLAIARAVKSDPLQSQRPIWAGWAYVIGSPIVFLSLMALLGTRNAA